MNKYKSEKEIYVKVYITSEYKRTGLPMPFEYLCSKLHVQAQDKDYNAEGERDSRVHSMNNWGVVVVLHQLILTVGHVYVSLCIYTVT